MSGVTAVVVCKSRDFTVTVPGAESVYHRSTIANALQFLEARFASIRQVRTPFFFWLDDDDELPDDVAGVLQRCVALDAALTYTDELVVTPDGLRRVRKAGEYSQAEHLRRPQMVHHLALCRTKDALEVLDRLPRGHLWPEMLLFWELAKRGAAYLPTIGYVWHRQPAGMHNLPSSTLAQVRTLLWCRRNLH